MKAAVVPKVGGKWEVREIPMSLIVTAVAASRYSAGRPDPVMGSGSRSWRITGMGLEV
jgi:hypothetical protein